MSLSPLSCLKVVSSTLSFLQKKKKNTTPSWDLWFYHGASYNTDTCLSTHWLRDVPCQELKGFNFMNHQSLFLYMMQNNLFFSEGLIPQPRRPQDVIEWHVCGAQGEQSGALIRGQAVSCITPRGRKPRPTKRSPTSPSLNKAEWCSFF